MATWTQENYNDWLSRQPGNQALRPQPQRPVPVQPVAEAQGEATHAVRFRISIVSHRKRLIDPDNLCPKYFIDCLRYAEIIPDDRPQDIELAVSQTQCAKGMERTEIIIERISSPPPSKTTPQ